MKTDYRHLNSYMISIERLRMVLMFIMFIYLMGFPTRFGGLVQQACSWVPIAFFIVSGFLVLRPSNDRQARIGRTIKRTAIGFGIMLIIYLLANFVLFNQMHANIFEAFASKRIWFEIVVLNTWPFRINNCIWYIQALLYAYIIIYFLEKLKLLKFDWVIIILCLVLTLLSGELAGFLKYSILGYHFFPGNFLTRALPYILLGGLIHRVINYMENIPKVVYGLGIVVGIVLMFAEIIVLNYLGVGGYFGHLLGMPIVAVCVCMFGFKKESYVTALDLKLNIDRWDVNLLYYIGQPVGVGIATLITILDRELFAILSGWIGIISFVICALIALGIAQLRKIKHNKNNKNNDSGSHDLTEPSYAELYQMHF